MKHIILSAFLIAWAPLTMGQSSGHNKNKRSYSISKTKLCEAELDKLMYNNYVRTQALVKEFKAYIKAQPTRTIFSKKPKDPSYGSDVSDVERAVETLEHVGSRVQPAFVITSKTESTIKTKTPTIHMKDIALKKTFKYAGSERKAVSILCAEDLVIERKRDKSALMFSVSATLSHLREELTNLIGSHYRTGDKLSVSDLYLPANMSGTLKNKYLDSVKKMISDIESVERRLGVKKK